MGDLGKIFDITKFRNEGDQIFAFKPQPDRYLCFFVVGKKILITNGFEKIGLRKARFRASLPSEPDKRVSRIRLSNGPITHLLLLPTCPRGHAVTLGFVD
jgi:hypothetical protein